MLKRIAARLLGAAQPPQASTASSADSANFLDAYIKAAPSAQNALDVFRGEWFSTVPGLQSGGMPLFDDPRITWGLQWLGGVQGQSVLELGPMEGGHTYMLEKAGARSIVGVESNVRAYLKCLIAKEVTGLQRARFLLGDFEEYVKATPERFDTAVASGVLYHVRKPVELLEDLARVSNRLILWTHYYQAERVNAVPHIARRFGEHQPNVHSGFSHVLHRQNYGDMGARFAGGTAHYSHWLSREDLLGALRHVGFSEIEIGQDDVGHSNGPAILLAARKPGA
jgi:hypothetical protein